MQAHKTEVVLNTDGRLELTGLPFRAGERVEVILLSSAQSLIPENRYPLRGTVIHYERPFDPVAEEDWEVLS